MTKLRVVALPLLSANLVAGVAIALAWSPPPAAEGSRDAGHEPSVQAFMALTGSAKPAMETGHRESKKPTTECVPCAQKGTEPIAGRVASGKTSQPVDGDYERITGRSRQFVLPSEAGRATRSPDRPHRGWIMIITGTPIRQTNAFVEIDADHLRVTRSSGGLRIASATYALTVPPQEPDARLLVESFAVFRPMSEHHIITWDREQVIGGMKVASVSARDIYAIPTGATWTSDAPHDVRIRLSPMGRIIQMEHVRAHGQASNLTATRVVWFPEYDSP